MARPAGARTLAQCHYAEISHFATVGGSRAPWLVQVRDVFDLPRWAERCYERFMDPSKDSLSVILFGVAAVLSAIIGARATGGRRGKLLWLMAVLLLALTVIWLRWPRLWPFLAPLWRSDALVVLIPVVITALIHGAAARKPAEPFSLTGPIFPRPKPRFREARDEAGRALKPEVQALPDQGHTG